jgi:alkylhydroperoxidase family enzyme
MDIGSAVSRVLGITEEDMAALPRYRDSDHFTEVEKLTIDLAVAMTDTPAVVSDELRAGLLRHMTKGQLAELAANIAWENHRARLNRALDVQPAGFTDGAYCIVPEHPLR